MALPTACFWPCFVPLQVVDALWCTWDRPLRHCLHDRLFGTTVVQLGPEDLRAPAARPPAAEHTDQDQELPGG
jgi:hypothetical protein